MVRWFPTSWGKRGWKRLRGLNSHICAVTTCCMFKGQTKKREEEKEGEEEGEEEEEEEEETSWSRATDD